jgi:hypothetical protein
MNVNAESMVNDARNRSEFDRHPQHGAAWRKSPFQPGADSNPINAPPFGMNGVLGWRLEPPRTIPSPLNDI